MQQRRFLPCRLLAVGLLLTVMTSNKVPTPLRAEGPATPHPVANDSSQVAGWPAEVRQALAQAGENRSQIEAALSTAPVAQRQSMQFLVAHMPEQDLQQLSAEFLLENVRLAHEAWEQAPWKADLPKPIFLNEVLPYACINERRDRWRKDFRERFQPLVASAKTPSQAAALLNQKIFALLEVRYSTQRRRADQSPLESIESGLASCTGLSVLLIDACRAVGVPARFVGTPLWSDGSGNHSWVEVWDQGWHFTGAAEPSGDDLDKAWFTARASKAQPDEPRHAIYATSFHRTPLVFPLVWQNDNRQVHAVNVTQRYAGRSEPLPDGFLRVPVRVLEKAGGPRRAANIEVRDAQGMVVATEQSRDERFDTNDHAELVLRAEQPHTISAKYQGRQASMELIAKKSDELVTLILSENAADASDNVSSDKDSSDKDSSDKDSSDKDSSKAVTRLRTFLEQSESERGLLLEQPFADVALTRQDSEQAQKLLWADHARRIRATRSEEMKQRRLKLDDLEMPFDYTVFGEKPADGRSLYLSLHGGGGAPKRVNDQQWENQKRLYRPAEGVYLAPRAPTDTWNLWHQPHIDTLFDRLIENLIVLEDVNPERVYVMGYSAGGDGVYQLAPRMADRWAAAAMMAGHPNDASPLGLRNMPFTLHMGGKDAAYNRNQVAATWKERLQELRKSDPEGYEYWVEIYPDKGHWMDRKDAAAVPWMAKFRRVTLPKRIVWKQDDVTHGRFYWLAVGQPQRKAGSQVIATRDGQRIEIQAQGLDELTIRLNDHMLDLDQPVVVTGAGSQQPIHEARIARTIRILARTLAERGDPTAVFSAEITVPVAESGEAE